jgi:hypothetical protein
VIMEDPQQVCSLTGTKITFKCRVVIIGFIQISKVIICYVSVNFFGTQYHLKTDLEDLSVATWPRGRRTSNLKGPSHHDVLVNAF